MDCGALGIHRPILGVRAGKNPLGVSLEPERPMARPDLV